MENSLFLLAEPVHVSNRLAGWLGSQQVFETFLLPCFAYVLPSTCSSIGVSIIFGGRQDGCLVCWSQLVDKTDDFCVLFLSRRFVGGSGSGLVVAVGQKFTLILTGFGFLQQWLAR